MKKLLLGALLGVMPSFMLAQNTILLNEDFESGGIPSTWTTKETNSNEIWSVDYQETNVAQLFNDWDAEPQDERLITPSLDFSAQKSYSLTFNIGLSYTWSVAPYDNYDFFIEVSTDQGITWTKVWSEEDLGVFPDWKANLVALDLSAYKGNSNVLIAFRYFGQDGATAFFDNVQVKSLSTLPGYANLSYPQNNAVNIPFNGTSLRWSETTPHSGADSYEVYLDTNPNPTTLKINTNKNAYTAFNLLPSTKYYWKVVPKNVIAAAVSAPIYTFTTAEKDYCGAKSLTAIKEKIHEVSFANINNTSISTDGYEDFTNIIGEVKRGLKYNFTAKGNFSNGDSRLMVWIDYNQNGVFETNEQVLGITDVSPWSNEITIPNDAVLGKTRMRIRLIDVTPTPSNVPNTTPCGSAGFGQVEDYLLDISGGLGVNNLSEIQIKSYPNPVKNFYNVESNAPIKEIQVLDFSGKLVFKKSNTSAKANIDFSAMSPGAYLVRIINADNSIHTEKVIKK